MKKLLVILAASALVYACGGNTNSGSEKKKETSTSTGTDETASSNDITKHPDYQAGIVIEGQSDCITCHRVDSRLQGPSYEEIANKYANSDTAIEYLAGKIKTGGSGVWGNIMMTPHPGLTEEELKTLARYVMLFKK